MTTCTRALLMTLALVLLAGCEEKASSTPEEPTLPELPEPTPGDALAEEMYRAASHFALHLKPTDDLIRGELNQNGEADIQAILPGAWCYRVLAVGEPSVRKLGLRLFDPDGVPVIAAETGEEEGEGAETVAVVGRRHSICPPSAGVFKLQVEMLEGEGEYGVQIFRTDS